MSLVMSHNATSYAKECKKKKNQQNVVNLNTFWKKILLVLSSH